MKRKILNLKNEISSYLESFKSEGPISFSVRDLERHFAYDADIYLNLFFENQPLAKAGVSYGLKDYYHVEDYGGIDFYLSKDPLVLSAVERANRKWGITLMQSFPGKKSLREKFSKIGLSYKEVLMNKMTSLSKKFDFPIEFYLPGNLVFWNLNSINQDAPFTCKGRYEIFSENYDSVAKKFGFQLSPDDSLYER